MLRHGLCHGIVPCSSLSISPLGDDAVNVHRLSRSFFSAPASAKRQGTFVLCPCAALFRRVRLSPEPGDGHADSRSRDAEGGTAVTEPSGPDEASAAVPVGASATYVWAVEGEPSLYGLENRPVLQYRNGTYSYGCREERDPMSQSSFEGRCLCGAVRYRLNGEPLVSGMCHCRTCRRTCAAPMLPFITFPLNRFTLTRGKPAEFHSSPQVTRSFCGVCGTPLTYRNDGHGDEIDVMTCSLDDPEVCPPSHHIWVSHKLGWVQLSDGLPAYDKPRI
jgi:hypothetical protein